MRDAHLTLVSDELNPEVAKRNPLPHIGPHAKIGAHTLYELSS